MLSRAPPAARRARVFAASSVWQRTAMLAVQGGHAGLWLSAVPPSARGRGAILGSAMRVATRLSLGGAPRSDEPRPRCAKGATSDAGRRHVLMACLTQSARRTALHHFIVARVAAALRRAPKWGAVTVERPLDSTDGAQRLDLCAVEAATGSVTWNDVSVACP